MLKRHTLILILVAIGLFVTVAIFFYQKYFESVPITTRDVGDPGVRNISQSEAPLPKSFEKSTTQQLVESEPPRPTFGTEAWYQLPYQERVEDMKNIASVKDEQGYSRFSYFPQARVLSGEYRKLVSSPEGMGQTTDVSFHLSESVRKQMPQVPEVYPRNFVFINNTEAQQAFGVDGYSVDDFNKEDQKYCYIAGKAEIEISDYFIDRLESEVMFNLAVLEKVMSKSPPKKACYSDMLE